MTQAWRAELLKIATVRGQWSAAVLAAVALPLSSLLVAATGGLGPHDTVTSGAAAGSVVALVAYGAWAAALTAGEYSRQTMVVSLCTVPSRHRLYLSKLAALTVVAGVGALVSAGLALMTVRDVAAPSARHLGHPLALLSIVLAVVAVVVIGGAVGILTRSPSASMAIVLVAVLGPAAAGGLLGGLQRWVVGASPGTVVTQMVGGGQLAPDQTFPGGPGLAAATLALVAVVLGVIGGLSLSRRDG